MMLLLSPATVVRYVLLMAVRDGYDRIVLRLNASGDWYDMVGRRLGRTWDLIPPPVTTAQEFPAVLAGLGRAWGRWSHWRQKCLSGSTAGTFAFPIGRSMAGGAYRVRWARRRVTELVIEVAATDASAVEADRELCALFPLLPDEHEAEPRAMPNPCISSDSFRGVAFSSSWRTDTARALARQIDESGEFFAMPILADALQDAGCDRAEILDHCRSSGPHVRCCWVVDWVLGNESH